MSVLCDIQKKTFLWVFAFLGFCFLWVFAFYGFFAWVLLFMGVVYRSVLGRSLRWYAAGTALLSWTF